VLKVADEPYDAQKSAKKSPMSVGCRRYPYDIFKNTHRTGALSACDVFVTEAEFVNFMFSSPARNLSFWLYLFTTVPVRRPHCDRTSTARRPQGLIGGNRTVAVRFIAGPVRQSHGARTGAARHLTYLRCLAASVRGRSAIKARVSRESS
jgi:hypothetical protein